MLSPSGAASVGEGDADGLSEADGETDALALLDAETDGLSEVDGETEADGLSDGLALADVDRVGLTEADADALAESEGDMLWLVDGDSDALGLSDGDADADVDTLGLRLGLALALGDVEGDALALGLVSVPGSITRRTSRYPPTNFSAMRVSGTEPSLASPTQSRMTRVKNCERTTVSVQEPAILSSSEVLGVRDADDDLRARRRVAGDVQRQCLVGVDDGVHVGAPRAEDRLLRALVTAAQAAAVQDISTVVVEQHEIDRAGRGNRARLRLEREQDQAIGAIAVVVVVEQRVRPELYRERRNRAVGAGLKPQMAAGDRRHGIRPRAR
jgi:hypothetical protein